MTKSLFRNFIRYTLIGFLAGNLVSPLTPNLAFSQSIFPEDKSYFREEAEPEKKTISELEEAIERARFIRYKQERWNEMRRRLESGEALFPEIEKPVPPAERKTLPQKPPPLGPGINVVLPYESGLSISGRKVIDFKLTSTIYDQPDSGKGRVNKTDFQLDQQLQVRVKGTVGRKVTVNVDFDDTREDKRNISVLYKGDPDEILQEASFGDISISLPGTSFVQYSKAVFGARAQLLFRPRTGFAKLFPSALWHRYTPKHVKLYLIGSRTKGITKTKRFTGQFVLQRREISDISYPRRQFYRLAFATGPAPLDEHRPIVVGSEKIFLDDQNPNNNNQDETPRTFHIVESSMTSTDGVTLTTSTFFGTDGSTNTGVFKLLVPGIDYTVDYVKGVIRFLRVIQLKDVMVADYTPVGETKPISETIGGDDPKVLFENKPGDLLKGFKPILLKPDESQFFATREMKNFYFLGDKRIARDDGRGNFILKILDLNNNEPDEIVGLDVSSNTQTKTLPKYPENIDVDFDNGIFSFVTTDTLRSPVPRPFTDDIYRFRDAVPSFKHRYKIFAEFRFKKGNYSLDQINIVSLSEQVFVDGRKMTRDVDYFIDYDIGIVTFFRPEQIRDDSIVEITYDFAPFGGSGQETLVGLRSEWYVTDNFFFGNSVLLNFAPRVSGVPDLRSTSRSITVLEADVNLKNIKFGKFPIEIVNIAVEGARSIKNPNTANKAIVESFEGVKLDDSANLNKDSWQVAANPEQGSPDPAKGGGAFDKGYAANSPDERGLFFSNEDVKITDINPGAPVETSDRLQALKVNYNLEEQYEAASMVHVLSRVGRDFATNRRQFLELWIHGDNSNTQLRFRLGGISEFSDSATTLRTEDEDNNGSLSPGEDDGWDFINPDGSTTTIGVSNGRLDTQDLDNNGKLDSDDRLGNYDSEISVNIDFNGWKIISKPLEITDSDQAKWSSIRHVRVTMVNLDGNPNKGSILFGRISVVGTRFEHATIDPSSAPVTATVFAENNEENPGYPSLIKLGPFKDLYEIDDDTPRRREQALAIEYQRTQVSSVTTTITTREVFTRALDFTDHKNFKFYLFGDMSNNDFIMRIGAPGNFLEYRTELSFSGWRLIELDILDKDPRDGQLDRNQPKTFGSWTSRVGKPDLRKITEIVFGVIVKEGGPDTQANKIYVNEIHLTESVKIVGNAWRANTDFSWPGWGKWGANWRFVDRNFQTLTSVGSGVDSKSGGAYLTIDRLAFLPLRTNLSYTETVTPQVQTVDDPNVLVSVIDEGKAIAQRQNLSGNFLMTKLPWIPESIKGRLLNINGSVDRSISFRSGGLREDETRNFRTGSSYSFPWQPDLLPTRFLTFKPFPTSISYSFSETKSIQRIDLENSDEKNKNTDTDSVTQRHSFRTSFQFFPRLGAVSPTYSFSKAFEVRDFLDRRKEGNTPQVVKDSLGKYNKSNSQAVSLASSLRIFSWLTPGFSYSIRTNETFNINEIRFGTSTFRRGTLKTISRSSNGNLSASFSPKDLFQYVRYLRAVNPMINSLTFNGGYTVTDADTYENMLASFDSRYEFLIRDSALDLSKQDSRAKPRRTSLTATDSSRISGRWTPFEGFRFMKSRYWAPIKNISGSGSFTETNTKRDTTGTESFSYSKVWPDFVMSTFGIEKTLFLSRWMSDTRLNGNYQERLSEVRDQTRSKGFNLSTDFTFTLFRLLQFSLGYRNSVSQEENLQTNQITSKTKSGGINGQVITTLKWGNWRFTPRYDQSQSESEDGTGKKTSDLVTRNASLQIFGDINIPRFFRLPFGKQLTLTNRLILTSSIRYGMIRDGVDETRSRDNIDSNLNGDFEITPNIRAGFGGSFSRTMHKASKEKDNRDVTTFGFNTRITIQF